MQRESVREIERDIYAVKELSFFKSRNLGVNKSFINIKNKFINYRFVEWVDEMKYKHNCKSNSLIIFKIKFKIENTITYFLLFSVEMDIAGEDEVEFRVNSICDSIENIERMRVDKLFNDNEYEDVYVKAEMSTSYHLWQPLDVQDQYEEEDSDNNNQPSPIIESCFIYDNCTICLSEIPNILFFPCLHLSVCENCEKVGNLFNCSVCRKPIIRKVKI